MVNGVRGGLVESETLFGGKEAVAFVAWPFSRGFLGSNADADRAVGVLLVPVGDVYGVLGGLD